ncbi:protein piccolo-like isoform X2 [Acanthaster planci]|uniref:Protein piccolo-like isoform X2 n=1 Tax=Acanthaster planci TaxID=133434 RepID=A0A8B7Y017_ACAPL|nr:protein piccolo-like isoform X2 [Acanthaster planci]
MAAIPDRERRWYFTRDVLLNSPSRKCQIEPRQELSYRQQAANLIQEMGRRLQVNQLCINTAIVYMHRFYVFRSFQRFPHNKIAAAALFLAAKVEEQPHKLEYVIKVHHACQHRGGPVLDTKSEAYQQEAQELVINESILLQTLGFEVAVDHPHTHVIKCTQMIRASKDLAQTSYFMANNSLHLTTFCLQYKPTVVACVCIYLAAKWSQWEIMRSSDGKDWWEYVDPTVTKELLDELTQEFLRIFEACPSRLRRRISKEQVASKRRPKEGTSEIDSASTAKHIPSSAASVSSIDSGLPGSGNSESSISTQDLPASSQGDSFSSQEASHGEGEGLALQDVNMGLPMMETSMFSLDTEYMSSTGYKPRHGQPSTQPDAEPGKPGDQLGHPVKKSLKEYWEQKERERVKNVQQSREMAQPRPSQTASRPSTMSHQTSHFSKGGTDLPHADQRYRGEGYHSQGGQKHRPEDRHMPPDLRRAEKPPGDRQEQSGGHSQAKSSGRPTDLRPNRDQRPHSQHRPHDPGSQPSQGANVSDSRYSKSTDQYHKHSRHSLPSGSSDRKQHSGSSVQGKEHKRNGFESRDHGANPRLPENNTRLPSSAPPPKPHLPVSQRPHHTETPNAHSLEKLPTSDLPGKAHAEMLRLSKSEMYRSQRPENQGNVKSEKHRTPSAETLRIPKSQSLKPQRSETPKGTPAEKERTQPAIPPLVPVDVKKEQRSAVETQRAELPQPIDQELPKPQRPERVLIQQPELAKVDRRVASVSVKHEPSEVVKTEGMFLHRSDTVMLSKKEVSGTKSAGVSKTEAPKSLKSDLLSKSHKTEESRLPRTETHTVTQKVENVKQLTSDMSRSKEAEVHHAQKPQQLRAVKTEPGTPALQTGAEKSDVTRAQKVIPLSQPLRPETLKKQSIKQGQGQTQRLSTPKSQIPQVNQDRSLLDKDSGMTSTKLLAKSQKISIPTVQGQVCVKLETPDVVAPPKPATHRKPPMPPASKPEAPVPAKPIAHSSEKVTVAKSKPGTITSESPEKAKPQKAETVTPQKTDQQSKPQTPKSQKSTTPRSRGSPGVAAEQVPKPPKIVEAPKAKVDPGKASLLNVVWEPAKPLEVLKPGVSDEMADSESVDADIDKLINAHMAEQSKYQCHEPPPILDLKPTVPPAHTSEPRERKRERDESCLPKSYREKESHHRKKRSEAHRSRDSPHKHRHSSDHRKRSRAEAEGLQSSVQPQASATEEAEDTQPHSSILTTSSGIRLKIKGLSNSMNSGTAKKSRRPRPAGRPARRGW